ncbi:Branched-chain amino acid transport ATP-binding protein LivF (TC 3.A.1.4.1) [plant metagenome]|uniref:Branched-chain amino acid transport ATP-binding protein LivF (TC 3.A.1.4.1) n=1 Tax=plant metagenome TaxID=1297885 RepID=A0A484P9K2_9ZZZZ
MTPEPHGLRVSGLGAGYGQGLAIADITLHCAPGETLGLVGRNGAGKTTLLRALVAQLPRDGHVHYAGTCLDRLAPEAIARHGIAYVPQGRGLFVDFSIEENLMLAAHALPAAQAKARDLLTPAYQAFPWLRDQRRSRAGSLSGGQQQQLAIARALVARPGLILLDEPLEGIQPSIVARIVQVLKNLRTQTRPTALLLVEQNLEVVRALCDRVLLLESGRLRQAWDARALRDDPGLIARHLAL